MAGERPVTTENPADSRLDPREFCGRVPWPLIDQLADGDEVVGCYVVRECRKLQTKAGQPYLRLSLGDRTGTLEAVVWEEVDRWEPACAPKSIVGIRGKVSVYQDQPQLRVVSVEEVRAEPADMEYLLPASKRDRESMERELDARIASVRDRGLRTLLRRCLGRESETGRAFRAHPAATRNHHAYLYGLLEHTLSVAGMCERLAEYYREQGVYLDRDLLVAGALLHDIGKLEELEPPPAPAYTTPGRLLGHIVLGVQMVGREGEKVADLPAERLLLLQHLVASHQGKPEWDSRLPQLLEALVLHYVDDLDAKLNQAGALLSGVEPGSWSEYDRSLGRSLYLPPTGGENGPARGNDPGDSVIDLFRG
jgi:3'-5' exoribonuclease